MMSLEVAEVKRSASVSRTGDEEEGDLSQPERDNANNEKSTARLAGCNNMMKDQKCRKGGDLTRKMNDQIYLTHQS